MTATEKYNSVLEGKLSEAEFVRQMRNMFPQHVTQWNGYKDSVSILKQRGLIFENKEVKKAVRDISDSFPLEAIDRGVDYELEAQGIDSTGSVTKEQYLAAKRKVVANLQKDQNHYLNLISGESSKVDKHDKYQEVKKNNHKDTFNDMKKADLKEGVEEADAIPTEPGVPGERASNHDRKMAMRNIIDFLTKDGHPDSGHKVSTQDALDFIKTHKDDIFSGDIDANDIGDVWHNYDEYESINRDDVGEVMGINRKGEKQPETEPSRFKGRDKSTSRAAKGMEEKMDAATMDAIKNYKPGSADERPHEFKPGDMFRSDFDYEGMLKAGLKVRVNTPVETMQKIYDSFEDVNYHRENRFLGDVIDAVEAGNKDEALEALRGFRKEIKNTLGDIAEGVFPIREREEGYVPRNERQVNERVGSLDEFISLIEDRAADNDTMPQDEAIEVMEALIEELDIPVRLVHDVAEDQLEEEPNEGKINERTDIVPTAELKASDAFRDAGINMNEPVLVLIQRGGHGEQETEGTISAQEALKMFKRLRAEGMKLGREDHYEFDNEIDFHAEGYEYKLSFFKEESTTTALMQKASVNEEPNEGNEFEAERLKAIKAGKKEFSVDGKTFPVKGAGEDEKKRAAMMKESVKAIVTKVLEEGTINEAATQELARIADDYAGFEGMKGAILDLQNLVSDIEAYYDKTREKIQKVYDTLGEIRNEEGLKVGGFLAPAIETAFMKDLRPVTKQGFTKGLDQPKVRVISQADIDAHNSGERPLGEAEPPKETVFTPNI